MAESKKINAYRCSTCGRFTVTIDRDRGVTPFQIGCRAIEGCQGQAYSSFYECPQDLTPTHEWFRPTEEDIQVEVMAFDGDELDLESFEAALRDHYERGGLALRQIDEA